MRQRLIGGPVISGWYHGSSPAATFAKSAACGSAGLGLYCMTIALRANAANQRSLLLFASPRRNLFTLASALPKTSAASVPLSMLCARATDPPVMLVRVGNGVF